MMGSDDVKTKDFGAGMPPVFSSSPWSQQGEIPHTSQDSLSRVPPSRFMGPTEQSPAFQEAAFRNRSASPAVPSLSPSPSPAHSLSSFKPPSFSPKASSVSMPAAHGSSLSSAFRNMGLHSPMLASPSLAHTSGSDHSRHSSGHASSVTGASASLYGGFGGSAASMQNTSGSINARDSSTGGSSASSSVGGGSATKPRSFSSHNSQCALGSVLARTQVPDSSLLSVSNGAADRSARHSFSDTSTHSPFADAALAPPPQQRSSSNDVPISLPTTGPLSASDPRTQLYVSNLPYRVRWQDLKDLFRRAGTVLRADVSLTPDNRSRGFGTVLLATEDDARRACDMFKGFNWQGRTLDVRIDRSGTLLGVGVGQLNTSILPPPHNNASSPALSAHRGTSPVPGALHPTVTPIKSPAQQPSGVSTALYPFLGASSRSSLGSPAADSTINSGYASPSSSGQHGFSVPRPNLPPSVPTGNLQHHMSSAQYASSHTMFGPPSNMYGVPQQFTGRPVVPNAFPLGSTYYGRVLFVGNLPFHCQWQDLKDLFRAAGNIQRADVALSAEGKSRGFGTVLFATPEDAQNAVRIYHGYEYSGRTLKVHFDRFAQMAAPNSGALPGSPSQYTEAFTAANTPTPVNNLTSMPTQPSQPSYLYPQQPPLPLHASTQAFQAPASSSLNAGVFINTQPPLGDGAMGKTSRLERNRSPARDNDDPATPQQRQNATMQSTGPSNVHPGRITLPPQGFNMSSQMAPFSPMHSRMNVPMTPGMPGFTFHSIPQTPPVHPHMFSPGLGSLLSPPLGSPPYAGPTTPGAASRINPAPGAPLHYSHGAATPVGSMVNMTSGFNPMFPPVDSAFQGSRLPQTPHWSKPAESSSHAEGTSQEKQDEETGALNEGYPFPVLSPKPTGGLQRRASMEEATSPKDTLHSTGTHAKSPGWERRGSLQSASQSGLGLQHIHASTGASSTEELAHRIAHMSAQKALKQHRQKDGRGDTDSATGSTSDKGTYQGTSVLTGSALDDES